MDKTASRSMPSWDSGPFWQELIPKIVEAYLLQTVEVDTGGSEANIALSGSLVSLFAPHSGWIESMIVDRAFERRGRSWPVWVTKRENESIPRILVGDRAIFIDLEAPGPQAIRRMFQVLEQPGATVASSIEGTRMGNPSDPTDLRTLGVFKTGMVRIAIKARVPILPVVILGGEQVVPLLDRVWQARGAWRTFLEIQRARSHPQPIQVRYLPPYHDHLRERTESQGRQLRRKAELHTTALRESFVEAILRLDPDYRILVPEEVKAQID